MPIMFKTHILSHLRDRRYVPSEKKALAEQLAIDDSDYPEFEDALKQLIADGLITLNKKGIYELPAIGEELVGRIRIHKKGFGFIIPEVASRDGDLFVPPDDTLNALSGDLVRAEVIKSQPFWGQRSGNTSHVGRVIEIVERARTAFVGKLVKRGSYWLVEVDGGFLNEPVIVRDAGAKDAKAGDKVLVEILKFPKGEKLAEGVITQRLGKAGIPDVETQSVILAYDLPGEFSEECIEQARDIASDFNGIDETILNEREDLREQFILTIDPPDAKDYDDAISIVKLGGKGRSKSRSDDSGVSGYELGIHIADVSCYIPAGSALDNEGLQRGNSVYLPRLVIPMLPELLSNGICSLQENVDRLTKSVFIRYDNAGHVQSARVCRSVIRSSKRLTYLEAEALMSDNKEEAAKHSRSESGYTDQLISTLKMMSDLAKRLRARRMKEGMIVLALPEVELIYDEEGHVIDAEPEDDASTHGLIEMFMVEANEAVARVFESLQVPLLRRIHPDPSSFDIDELKQYCRVAGITIPKNPTRLELQKILETTRGTPRQQAVHLAVLKSLSKAEYSPAIIGHFALASSHYAHFTSPIRRYPDLLVHRALEAYLDNTTNGRLQPKGKAKIRLGKTLRDDKRCPDEDKLQEMGNRCNQTERNAEVAESSLRTFLVLQFLAEKHMGDTFSGVITGFSAKAIWIQLDKYLVEGMVKIEDLPAPFDDNESEEAEGKGKSTGKDKGKGKGKYISKTTRVKNGIKDKLPQFSKRADRWKLNSDTGSLVHGGTGKTITIGDSVKAGIVLIDPPARRMDLMIVEYV